MPISSLNPTAPSASVTVPIVNTGSNAECKNCDCVPEADCVCGNRPNGSASNNEPQTQTPVTSDNVRTVEHVLADLDRTEQLVNEFFCEPEEYKIDSVDCEIPVDFKLTVVIPVYNEENTIARVVGRVLEIPVSKEVIIIDDCSTDRTREILSRIEKHDDVKVFLKEENGGKGAALRTGFEAATGDIIVVQDADLEYDSRDIPKLLPPIIRGESDVVYGSRFIGEELQDESWIHRFGNGVLTGLSNLTTGLKLTDMETCYKAFRRDVLQSVDVEQNRFGFEPEITAKLAQRNATFTEVPIRYDARTYEEGKKIGVKDLFNAFWCIAKYGWFSKK